MSPPKDAHYTLSLVNHQTGQRLNLEMIDLPFPSRSYRLRVNGQWARKLPVASKTAVAKSSLVCAKIDIVPGRTK